MILVGRHRRDHRAPLRARRGLVRARRGARRAAGLVHSYRWTPGDTAIALRPAWQWAAGYALMACWLLAARWLTVESDAGH